MLCLLQMGEGEGKKKGTHRDTKDLFICNMEFKFRSAGKAWVSSSSNSGAVGKRGDNSVVSLYTEKCLFYEKTILLYCSVRCNKWVLLILFKSEISIIKLQKFNIVQFNMHTSGMGYLCLYLEVLKKIYTSILYDAVEMSCWFLYITVYWLL